MSSRRTTLAMIAALSLLFAIPIWAQTKKPRPGQAKEQVKQEQPEKPSAAPKAGEALGKDEETKGEEKKGDEGRPKDPMSSKTFDGLKLRLIGPAVISGRVVDFAVNPKNRAEYYAAAASGGLWKTTNAGTTWTPVFDHEGSYSIGAVRLDPKDASVVWVGTGESNAQRSVAYGDGVYKSEDAGRSWKNVGLKKSEHIGRIAIDPSDSKVVYVAAQGPLWGPGGDRGLFKTTDGGKSWKNILSIGENTGVTDVVIDPDNPDTLYAASWQRRRHVYTLIDGGPESAIYKSSDAGATWSKLKSGLPTEEMGRIGLAISPADSSVLYATIEAANDKSGIFRSSDRGATWEKRSGRVAQGMYYGQIVADPKNVDRVYMMNVINQVSDDGGKTFHPLGEKSKHVDNHALWIDPNDTSYYLAGCDGGVYESHDRGANWSFKSNLPLGQFYDVTYDLAMPFYNVYGGTQDNSSWGGPSRTRNTNGITNADWFNTHGGDGFRSQVDPTDPNTVYAELQYGDLVRYDRRTGEAVGIQPLETKGEPPLRWNWDSPFIISPHSHTRLYFAAQKVYRSDDRGDTWKAISGDLTRQIDRNKLPVMGKVWGPDAVAKNQSTSFYGNIVAMAESPKKEGVLYIGTDDGLIQATEDGGQHWTKYDKFPGVPENTFVARLATSNHDITTVYAAFDNHKNSDFKPYLLKSNDGGKSWSSISGNLPENGPVLAIAEDTANPNLLFAGTEFGLFFTVDGGKKWVQLKGNFPTISVRDVVVHPREGDLIVATFGRGIYILDDITPLRRLKPEALGQPAFTSAVKDALMYVQARPIGGRGKAFMGESYYTADNPPYGAMFTFYLKDKLKTKKELRQEAEKEAARKGQTRPYPSHDELRAEVEELPASVFLVVYDANGNPLRRISAQNAPGYQRVAWDLRYPAPSLPPEVPEGDEDVPFQRTSAGALVMPGQYTVKLFKKSGDTTAQLGESQMFKVAADGTSGMKPEDRAALADFQQKVAKLYRAVSGSIRTGEELKTRMKAIRRALQETPGTEKLLDSADKIDEQLSGFLRMVRGDTVLLSRNENVPASINDRVSNIMSGERFAIQRPTQTHLDAYTVASQDFTQELAGLHTLVEVDLKNLEKAMEAAGAPWTPGRVPEFRQ